MCENKEIIWERKQNYIITSENDVVIEIDQNGKQIFKFDPNKCGIYKINGENKYLPINRFYKFQNDK